MNRHAICIVKPVLILAIILLPGFAFGQDIPGVTGVGVGSFPGSPVLDGVPLTGLEFAMSVSIPGDATAEGLFHATLLGTSALGLPLNIQVDGIATGGYNGPVDRIFTGTATVDMGTGTPLLDVPIAITATATSLVLEIGSTMLPAVPVTQGLILID